MANPTNSLCRLCPSNLATVRYRALFQERARVKERLLSQRFNDIGVVLPCSPGIYSDRVCVKCVRLLVTVEDAMSIQKKWQVEHNLPEEDGPSSSTRREEKRTRASLTPTKTPRKEKKPRTSGVKDLERPNASTTEVTLTFTNWHACCESWGIPVILATAMHLFIVLHINVN